VMRALQQHVIVFAQLMQKFGLPIVATSTVPSVQRVVEMPMAGSRLVFERSML
jgi:dihydroorotate dehydrogenase